MKRIFTVFCLLALMLVCGVNSAFANLLITPTILVFDGQDRFANITLVNNGKKTFSYEMKWVNYNVKEDGSGYTLEDDYKVTDRLDISEYMALSPRRVTLKPGESQKLRIALRRPPNLSSERDYRVHLRFSVIGVQDKLSDVFLHKNAAPGEKARASASVNVQVNYTIPIVIRTAKWNGEASVGQISMSRDPGNGRLSVAVPVLKDSPGRSLLSYLKIYDVVDGKQEYIGGVSNANVYDEINSRTFNIILRKEPAGKVLRVVLENFEGDEPYVYAQREFPLR